MMKCLVVIFCALQIWLLGASKHTSAAEVFDLVISSGRVLDPESGLDGVRDIGINDGKIIRISSNSLTGRKTIDAAGYTVAPGFIDLHAHGQQLPSARMQAFDGVTTALELEGGVLPVKGFYDRVAAEGRPINYGASVSWAAVRAFVFDGVDLASGQNIFNFTRWTSTLGNEEQVAQILTMLERGLNEGAIGVGILAGYAPASGHKEYYAINKLAAEYGVPTFTHIRNLSVSEPRSSFESYQEMIATAAATGAHMHVCHLNSTSMRDIPAVVELISKAQANGIPLSVEAYPYGAGSTAIGAALFRGDDWRIRMGNVTSRDFEVDGIPLTEKQFERLQDKAPTTPVVVHFMRPDKNPKDQAFLDMSVLYPGGAIASDGGSWTLDNRELQGDIWPLPELAYSHPRSAGAFSRFIRQYVNERKVLTLMEAVRKASLIPAQILERAVPEMKNKGRLRLGADADIIIFKVEEVSDRATFNKPAQTSTGMKHVIVNGILVISEGELVRDALPGKPVRTSNVRYQ